MPKIWIFSITRIARARAKADDKLYKSAGLPPGGCGMYPGVQLVAASRIDSKKANLAPEWHAGSQRSQPLKGNVPYTRRGLDLRHVPYLT